MPYTPAQQRAIASKMTRQGKSRKEISAFFHKHGKAATKRRWGSGSPSGRFQDSNHGSAAVRG